MASVELLEVSKVYPGNVMAVDRISLSVRDREFLVLVGPSGCGKSTTLRMVAGLEEISSGTLKIGDRIVNNVAPKDRDIAMVFQNYALYPHMSVYQNMAFGLKIRRRELGLTKADIDRRVREAAEMLNITPYLDRKPKALSGGQRQRVAVGRAIVRNPKAFLFDEPLSNLDAKLRIETRASLKRLHLKLQTTSIYVTHDQEEAMTLGDRIVVMKDGKIQQCATPLEVYDSPTNRFVAGFVGTPPMNFINGQLQGGMFTFGQQSIALPARLSAAAGARGLAQAVLGVRPESMTPGPEEKFHGQQNIISAQVTVVEPLGDKVDVYAVTASGESLVCRADARQYGGLTPTEPVAFAIDVTRMHLFEPGDNGQNLGVESSVSCAA